MLFENERLHFFRPLTGKYREQVDEVFSKMDESRSREVIDYLTCTLGLQLIFIMPTSKCGPFMDLISNEFVFATVPSVPRGELLTRVLVDRKECKRERIEEIWSRHRRTFHQQAELDCMNELEVDESRSFEYRAIRRDEHCRAASVFGRRRGDMRVVALDRFDRRRGIYRQRQISLPAQQHLPSTGTYREGLLCLH